jgi:hypothetical protein
MSAPKTYLQALVYTIKTMATHWSRVPGQLADTWPAVVALYWELFRLVVVLLGPLLVLVSPLLALLVVISERRDARSWDKAQAELNAQWSKKAKP